MSSEAVVHFPIDQGMGQPAASLEYRPYGTHTLKIKATTAQGHDNLPPLRLRLRCMANLEAGMTCGYADEGQDFLISWGGGHETGPCLKAADEGHIEGCVTLKASDKSYLFLNITHVDDNSLPDAATLTLEAYDPNDGKAYASLPVTLKKPVAFPADVVRLVKKHNNEWQATGSSIAAYDPRWWPAAQLNYHPLTAPLPLTIRQDGVRLLVEWAGRPGGPIIILKDKTDPSMLTEPDVTRFAPGSVRFELFDWDEEYVALRVWFFWLNTKIGFHYAKAFTHEVPDAERFDFIIRKKTGTIALACTDLHWREVWGQATAMPVAGFIGLTPRTFARTARLMVFDKVLAKLVGTKTKLSYPGLRGYLERLAEDMARQEDTQKRITLAPGNQAHVPTLLNVTQNPQLTSADVRQG
jgi:hypothetical protein